MTITEQRIRGTGTIRVLVDKVHVGKPVARNITNDVLICIKNVDISKRLSAFLDTDGLTKNEVKKFLESLGCDDIHTYLDFLKKYSRSLDWGLAYAIKYPKTIPNLNLYENKLKVKGSNIRANPSDILFSFKFLISYKIHSTHQTKQTDDFFMHLLINEKPTIKAFDISHTMSPFSEGRRPMQIVIDNNPKLEKSLSKDFGFSFVLDSIRHEEEIRRLKGTYHCYEFWNSPLDVIISNRELPNWFFPIYGKVSKQLKLLESPFQKWMLEVEAIDTTKDSFSDKLMENLTHMRDMVRLYLSMQNKRLP